MHPCRKCLLSETDEKTLYATIAEHINNIPPEHKTAPAEYKRRLEICKACNHLISGMCALCGCYVELRAAKAWQSCVESKDRW